MRLAAAGDLITERPAAGPNAPKALQTEIKQSLRISARRLVSRSFPPISRATPTFS
jgi:hypothetical protein